MLACGKFLFIFLFFFKLYSDGVSDYMVDALLEKNELAVNDENRAKIAAAIRLKLEQLRASKQNISPHDIAKDVLAALDELGRGAVKEQPVKKSQGWFRQEYLAVMLIVVLAGVVVAWWLITPDDAEGVKAKGGNHCYPIHPVVVPASPLETCGRNNDSLLKNLQNQMTALPDKVLGKAYEPVNKLGVAVSELVKELEPLRALPGQMEALLKLDSELREQFAKNGARRR